MTVERIGYGAGQKDFPQPNMLRLLVGEVASSRQAATVTSRSTANRIDRGAGNESRQRDRRSDRACRRALVGGRRARCVADADPNEEGSAGRAGQRASAGRPMPTDWKAILFAETPTLGVRRSTVIADGAWHASARTVETPGARVLARSRICRMARSDSRQSTRRAARIAERAWRVAGGSDGARRSSAYSRPAKLSRAV